MCLLLAFAFGHCAFAAGIPEPSPTYYGVIRNQLPGPGGVDTPITTGTLVWTFGQPGGPPVAVTSTLALIDGQYSYMMQVPFATEVPGVSMEPGSALRLHPSGATYDRSHITVNGFPAGVRPPSSTNFYFSPNDRATVERVDLDVWIPSDTDTDGDGLPDDWELRYFGGTTNANPNALAANGVNTVREAYIADLNPTNPASVFPALHTAVSPVGTMNLVIDPTSTARIYGVYSTTNLLAQPQTWTLLPSEIPGNGASLTFPVSNEPPLRHYRTGVRLP